jgi:hypothetical protein
MAGAYWLRAPAGTAITGLSWAGAFNSDGGWVAHWATALNGGGDPGADCGTLQGCSVNFPNDDSVAVNNASLIGFGLWCDASTCAKNAAGSLFGPAGSANVFNATIYINDPSPPPLVIKGNVYGYNPSGWISDRNVPNSEGQWTLTASATDPGGVCNLNIQVASLGASNDTTPNYGASSATPCNTSGPSAVLNLNPCQAGGLPAGRYTSSASATNPANMTSSTTGGLIQVECSGPTVNVTSTQNLANWYTGQQAVVVSAGDESGLQGNVSCSVGPGGDRQAVTIAPSQLPYSLPVTANGANDVSCTAENNVNYTTTANLGGEVLIDNQIPTVAFGGSQAAPAWVSGPQTITVTGSETTSLSGIGSVSCQLDGGGWRSASGAVAKVEVSGDGPHTLNCYSTTNAGVQSPTESYSVQLDSAPPTVSFSNGPSQTEWSTRAQSITVTASKPAGLSGVDRISCTLNQQTTDYTDSGAADSQSVRITVQPPGGVLTCRALDHASNWSSPQAWSFLIDDAAPTGAFQSLDPIDPARVTLDLQDADSGVKGAQIELQTASGWRQLPTTLNGDTAFATIPDDGTIPDGTYNLQALVWDVAGNEATITLGSSGNPESVTLPLRIVTRLTAGVPKVAIRFGKTARVRGMLETIDGTPIPGQRISITQQPTGWSSQPAGFVKTDPRGRFDYRLPAGASRLITFTYAGTNVLRTSNVVRSVRVIGSGRIAVARTVVAGGSLRIAGRVFGGYVPSSGVLVQLQYKISRIPVGWAPFAHAVQTDSRGRWGITFPVSSGARGYTYLFRALISEQSGWPFLTTTSNVVSRHVF